MFKSLGALTQVEALLLLVLTDGNGVLHSEGSRHGAHRNSAEHSGVTHKQPLYRPLVSTTPSERGAGASLTFLLLLLAPFAGPRSR